MKSNNSNHPRLCVAFICSIILIHLVSPAAKADQVSLTIENNTPLPLEISLGTAEDIFENRLGYVDPVSRESFTFNRDIGRWYIRAKPPLSDTSNYEAKVYTLYIRQNQSVYTLDIMEKDFSDRQIFTGENVSLEGTWQGMEDLQVKFTKMRGVYVGTLVSVPDFLQNRGYYVGMEGFRLNRTGFNSYEGVAIDFRQDGSRRETAFSCSIVGGSRLNPQGWVRVEANQDGSVIDLSGTWNSNIDNTYVITQNGKSFSWTVVGHEEVAEGTIDGKTVSAKWGNEHGKWLGSASGEIETVDGQGRGTKIVWSNGAVFTRGTNQDGN
jgi:hypothetical protein